MRRLMRIVHIFIYVMLFSGFVKSQEMHLVNVKVQDTKGEKNLAKASGIVCRFDMKGINPTSLRFDIFLMAIERSQNQNTPEIL